MCRDSRRLLATARLFPSLHHLPASGGLDGEAQPVSGALRYHYQATELIPIYQVRRAMRSHHRVSREPPRQVGSVLHHARSCYQVSRPLSFRCAVADRVIPI